MLVALLEMYFHLGCAIAASLGCLAPHPRSYDAEPYTGLLTRDFTFKFVCHLS